MINYKLIKKEVGNKAILVGIKKEKGIINNDKVIRLVGQFELPVKDGCHVVFITTNFIKYEDDINEKNLNILKMQLFSILRIIESQYND